MTALPPGIYRISLENQHLSRAEQVPVTLLPAHEGPDQEFEVHGTPEGNYVITKPSPIRPSTYLTYDGAPEKPDAGARVLMRLSEFPPCEWKITQGAGPGTFTIAVAGTDLTIGIAPPRIYPPFLELKSDQNPGWTFERIRDE
ncbi:hypothetical protein AB0H77_29125 [Streptomyces sp. NPDC050844]|uniref:hypothetical protein n=1 Tax=Streptomyces sp. NPDC050844 TaxID=3155790 RepID=UPI0033F8D417